MRILSKLPDLLHPQPNSQTITIVSGLPRSGTSMMMKMLEAGGMAVLTDHYRQADADNPRGYYEFERVKRLPEGDYAWLGEARGKAVKVIATLLEHLPPTYQYRVIFMHRRMEEILASQIKMLVRRGEATDKAGDEGLKEAFESHVRRVHAWLATQHNITVLDVDYNQLLDDPGPPVLEINRFLGVSLDADRMLQAIDPALYRNRASTKAKHRSADATGYDTPQRGQEAPDKCQS